VISSKGMAPKRFSKIALNYIAYRIYYIAYRINYIAYIYCISNIKHWYSANVFTLNSKALIQYQLFSLQ